MNIKQAIENVLAESGWSPLKLANKAGISKDVIYRILRGDREGMNSKTLEKLWPFIYGDKRPKPTEDKAA